MSSRGKLSSATKWSYGLGGLGEGIGYNLFFGFFLFFLTNVAGMNPAVAGAICMVAVIWDAVTDPMIGFLSDHSRNPKGRRRPFLFKGSILLGVSLFLLFTNIDISSNLKVFYYVFMNILYWVGLTSCVIPHTSLGAELTSDFNERTSIRAHQTFFMNIGAGVALSTTLIIVGLFSQIFPSASAAWATTGAFFGIIAFLAYFICFLFTKGKEPANINLSSEKQQTAEKHNFFKEYMSILGNKPLRYILFLDFAVNFILGISVSVRIYLYTYTFAFSEGVISALLLVYSVIIVVGVYFANLAAHKLGKKTTMVYGIILYALGFLLVYIAPANTATVGAGLILEGLGNCTFWCLIYSFVYDSTIIEKYKHGKGNEGIAVSMIGLFMKFGNALGMMLTGFGLSYIGFNAELVVQSATTMSGLKALYCIASAVSLLVGAAVFSKYPLTEEKYELLCNAIDNNSKLEDAASLRNLL